MAERQHYVQRAYLDRWARDRNVCVRWRDGKAYPTNPVNVAVECGFYDIATADGDVSREVEDLLGEFEGDAVGIFRRIDESGIPPAEGSHDRQVLAAYLALQVNRTPEQRERMLFPERVHTWLSGRDLTVELVEEYLRDVHLLFAPARSEVQGAFDFAAVALDGRSDPFSNEWAITTMLTSSSQIEPALLHGFSWTVEHERKGRFITSDSPVTLWRTPSERDRYQGFGYEDAEEVRFPLDPTKQLVLTPHVRPPSVRVSPARADDCNREVVASCHQFIVMGPSQRRWLDGVPLKSHRPVLRFNSGPCYEQRRDGSRVYKGEMIHTWIPRC